MNHLLPKTFQKELKKTEGILPADANEGLESRERPQSINCELTCMGQCRYSCGGCWTSNCVGGCASWCGRAAW